MEKILGLSIASRRDKIEHAGRISCTTNPGDSIGAQKRKTRQLKNPHGLREQTRNAIYWGSGVVNIVGGTRGRWRIRLEAQQHSWPGTSSLFLRTLPGKQFPDGAGRH